MSREFCCKELQGFVEYWEKTGMDVCSEIIKPKNDKEYSPFNLCPYCGKKISENKPELDAKKDYALEWDNKLEIGVPWIDLQHKKLFDQVNNLINVVVKHDKYEEAGSALKFLQNYVKAHFGTEENIMLKHGFPGYNTQKKQHEYFVKRIETFSEEHIRLGSTQDLALRVARELWIWFKAHIMKADAEFGEYLKNKNIHNENESPDKVFNDLMEGQKK